MLEYPQNMTNITFTWLSSLCSPFNKQLEIYKTRPPDVLKNTNLKSILVLSIES